MFIQLICAFAILNVAFAALPIAPYALTAFPERDLVVVEGFGAEFKGFPLLVDVTRNDASTNNIPTLIGSALGPISGDPLLTYEINHPGGLCWGDGTNLKVTPDIRPGDVISMKQGITDYGEMTILTGSITSFSVPVDQPNTVLINGFIGAEVDPANIEVGIVNPAYRDTLVARRDVRAIVGDPVVTDNAYTSNIVVNADRTFVATFTFVEAINVELTVVGGAKALSMWQATDTLGNALGLTISEFGEVGGPYSGLCPASALTIDPVIPTKTATFKNQVLWNSAQNIPGAVPFNGYSVSVIKAGQAFPKKVEGFRVDQVTTSVSYDAVAGFAFEGTDVIQVRTIQGEADKLSGTNAVNYADLAAKNAIVPTLTANPPSDGVGFTAAPNGVTFASSTDLLVYTMDGSEPLVGTELNTAAFLYAGETISIAGETTIKAVAFTPAGAVSAVSTLFYSVDGTGSLPLPQPVTSAVLVNRVNGGFVASWAEPLDDSISSYTVRGFDVDVSNTTAFRSVQVARSPYTFTGLTVGKRYQFDVISRNSVGDAETPSPKSAISIAPDSVVVTSIKYVAAKEFRIGGNGDGNGAILTVHHATAQGAMLGPVLTPQGVPITGLMTNCVAGVCAFDIRYRGNQVPNPRPEYIIVKSSMGGYDGPRLV